MSDLQLNLSKKQSFLADTQDSSSMNQIEVDKFSSLSNQWWDLNGDLKTLHAINPLRVEFITQYVALPTKRVLDIGCGGGILSESLASLQAEVIGLDASKDLILVAERHAFQSQLGILYVCELIENYDAPLFDVVTCMELLEHVDSPDLVIGNAARLLKPGGYLFLSTINRTIQSYASAVLAAEYILRLLPRQTHDYEKFIKPSELADMCCDHGLSLVDIKGFTYDPFQNHAKLTSSVAVNYLLVCQKPVC